MRQTIRIVIGICVILWWIGSCILQGFDLYPYNNLILDYSSKGLIVLLCVLIIHDIIIFKSIYKVFDFFPKVTGRGTNGEIMPSISDWTKKETWKSIPKWATAITVFWVFLVYIMNYSFSVPNIENEITSTINKDKKYCHKIGKIKGYSFYRGGSSFNSQDSSHIDLTIIVYGEKGNFPLNVSIDFKNNKHWITRID